MDHVTEHYNTALRSCDVQKTVTSSVEHEAMTFGDLDELVMICLIMAGISGAFLFSENVAKGVSKFVKAKKNV